MMIFLGFISVHHKNHNFIRDVLIFTVPVPNERIGTCIQDTNNCHTKVCFFQFQVLGLNMAFFPPNRTPTYTKQVLSPLKIPPGLCNQW